MQPFCFFVATKEVGVRGLVPEIAKDKKLNFVRAVPPFRTTRLAVHSLRSGACRTVTLCFNYNFLGVRRSAI